MRGMSTTRTRPPSVRSPRARDRGGGQPAAEKRAVNGRDDRAHSLWDRGGRAAVPLVAEPRSAVTRTPGGLTRGPRTLQFRRQPEHARVYIGKLKQPHLGRWSAEPLRVPRDLDLSAP